MPIVKCKNYVEVYETKAKSRDPNELSGRTGRPDLTRFICKSIIRKLSVNSADVLIDIGCGNGALLKLISGIVFKAIGVLPTNTEIERVRDLLGDVPNIQIRKGLAQSTELPSQLADKVVINGVFIFLTNPQVDDAFKEIARILKPNGLVFIGEVPCMNELEERRYGDSISLWLWWVLQTQGIASFLARLRQTTIALLSSEPLIIAPKTHFFSEPSRLIERAKNFGLILKAHFHHREIMSTGEENDSMSRWDYIFQKAEG
jgi:SAM-dependent methyltransferase